MTWAAGEALGADHRADHNSLSVSVKRYGSVGDGVADDTAALVAALSDAAGDRLFLPDGTYLCSQALAVDTAGTEIVAAGRAVIQFTAATDGLDVTAPNCRLENVTLRAGHSGCLTALDANAASYLSLINVDVDRAASMSWATGWDFTASSNVGAFGGGINAHDAGAGTIATLMRNRDTSRGNTFVGVSLKGRNNAGEYTERGVYVTDGGGISWFGGVVQGGFSEAAVDVDGGAGSPSVYVYSPHMEVSGGGGAGYRYDDSTGRMAVIAPRGGSMSVGPTANAWDFAVYGGWTHAITLGAFAQSPVIAPSQVTTGLTDSGASNPRVGSFRVVGNSTPEHELFRALEGYEISDPAAPDSNHGVLYFRDNGTGKTQLCVRFATGAVQVVATEP